MKLIIKELIDELIYFEKERQPLKYLNAAVDQLGKIDVLIQAGEILTWHKEASIGLQEPDYTPVDAPSYLRHVVLFEKCPQLNEAFSLQQEKICFAPGITDTEKEEIREYIDKHHKVVLKLTKRRKR